MEKTYFINITVLAHCKKFYKGDGKFLGYYEEKLEASIGTIK